MSETTANEDLTVNTHRYVRVTQIHGGHPVLDLEPATSREFEFDGEMIPAEPLVLVKLGGEKAEFRPEALRAALAEVERLREES